ncbi:MAG TPA: S1C family serine protease [Gemmata sp.]|nr:S1C family serine protease [Gemmata sp.]
MRTRRVGHWIPWLAIVVAVLFSAIPNKAADPRQSVKWDTTRVTEPEDLDELKALQSQVTAVVDKCSPCTVAILIGFGAGSGVIVSDDGLVLTAAHVIAGESRFGKQTSYEAGRACEIVLSNGKRVKGETLGINDRMDSGMVKITEKGPNNGKWPFAPIAKSGDVKKGQWVVALGHPGGPKTGRGPVARLGRIENSTKDLLRTNCTLVGGDSGGPLFDLDGRVIGIHSRIGFTLAQNIHVPTDVFKTDWDKLVAGDVIGRQQKKDGNAVIGVVFPEDENDDAWVAEVDDEGPAAKAGLKLGDTIVKFNGEQVKTVKKFRDLIKDKKPGEVVKLTVRRSTEIIPFSVTLGKRG